MYFSDPFALIAEWVSRMPRARRPFYANDQDVSIFMEDADGINTHRVPHETFTSRLLDIEVEKFPGVITPYSYFGELSALLHHDVVLLGMSGTCFGTHVEDMDLCSVSYLKEGAAKVGRSCLKPYHPSFRSGTSFRRTTDGRCKTWRSRW